MRNLIWIAPVLFLGTQIGASADTIPAETRIQVTPDQGIQINKWDRGRIYMAHVAMDVYARSGDVAIPRGSEAELMVRQTGPGQMALDLESVTVRGHRYALDTAGPHYNMPGDQYNSGAGLLGNIVGAISGGNVQVETRGNRIHVPAGTVVTFNLLEPLHQVGWGDPGYDRDHDHYHRDGDWYR